MLNSSADELYEVLSIFRKSISDSNFIDLLMQSTPKGYPDFVIKDGDFLSGKILGRDMRVSSASDSIVMSFNENIELFQIFQSISYIQHRLLEKNIMIRGGIDIGNIYHQDEMIFGPALISAYHLEKTIKLPMISLSKRIIDDVPRVGPMMAYIRKLKDSYFYFDFVAYSKSFLGFYEKSDFDNNLKNILVNLQEQKIEDTDSGKEKVSFMCSYLEKHLFSESTV